MYKPLINKESFCVTFHSLYCFQTMLCLSLHFFVYPTTFLYYNTSFVCLMYYVIYVSYVMYLLHHLLLFYLPQLLILLRYFSLIPRNIIIFICHLIASKGFFFDFDLKIAYDWALKNFLPSLSYSL